MPTRNEREALEIINEKGGETSIGNVASHMGLSTDYTRIILESLGRRDFIDVLVSRKVRLTPKGWKELGKTPTGSKLSDNTTPESPEEKYKKWTSS
ncbi:MAG: hypothetical protein ACE5HY_03145 [Candidatus Hydrothermarchaeales archaeon]